MHIPSSLQGTAETIRDVPGRVLSMLADGQNLQATVLARLAPDLVKIKIADTILQLKTDQSLQPGQQVLLQKTQQAGETVLKLQPLNLPKVDTANLLTLLTPGRQVAVEVVKLLAEHSVLVKPVLLNTMNPATTASRNEPAVTRLPAQLEIDVRALQQTFKPGDKMMMEVVREQPLNIVLRSDMPTRAEQIQRFQQALLPQVEKHTVVFETINRILPKLTQLPVLQQTFSQLLQHVSEKSDLQTASGLKSSLDNSGVFLESRLKSATTQSVVINQDFKANLLRVANEVQQQINTAAPIRLDTTSKVFQALPRDIQQALRQVISSPQALQTLPAQIHAFLATQGQSPAQLLRSLMSAVQPGVPAPEIKTSIQNPTPVIGNRTVMSASATEQLTQAQTRLVEWQMLRDVMREVSSIQSRIQLNQLAMLKDPDMPNNVNVWLFDLPVKERQQLEMMQLRIEQHHGQRGGEENAIWQVQLNLETANLGPMQAHISLYQSDVKVVVLAEQVKSAQLLTEHVDELNQRLQGLGVNVSHISCRQAPISTESSIPAFSNDPSNMVDISV